MLFVVILLSIALLGLAGALFVVRKNGVSQRAANLRMAKRNDALLIESDYASSESDARLQEIESLRRMLADAVEQTQRKDPAVQMLGLENQNLKTQLLTAESKIVSLVAQPAVYLRHLTGDYGQNAALLWQLQLTRIERLWRAYVATNPIKDVSPFGNTETPVQLMVETEAAALREMLGVDVQVEWKAVELTNAATNLVIVAVARELLEMAAATHKSAVLVIGGDEPSELKLELQGPAIAEIDLTDGQLESDLIELRTTDEVVVTVSV